MSVAAVFETIEASRKAAAFDDLKKLNGDHPYDGGSNIVRSDGYFAASLERSYGKDLTTLAEWCGYAAYRAEIAAYEARKKAGNALVPIIKTLSADRWARAVEAYADSQMDVVVGYLASPGGGEMVDREPWLKDGFAALLDGLPEADLIAVFNKSDWWRAIMAYMEVPRLERFKGLDQDASCVISLQRCLTTLATGWPDPQYLPEIAK